MALIVPLNGPFELRTTTTPSNKAKKVLIPTVLKKIDLLTSKGNPSTQKEISRKAGVRRAYYTTNAENNSLKLVLPREKNFYKQFMAGGAMSGRGVLPLIKVPQKVKVSAKYDVDRVSKPLLE
ncbi:hypothetical protein Fcan01_21919 [Folsomia candida]|uniref:Uncharacterized protein n=1 Tax=Folsomia candida TaxID=158441 RepID=A0A226DD84_FOLCA|nr:hypothetical protein Fcan01_21919 [Folsomia candida]